MTTPPDDIVSAYLSLLADPTTTDGDREAFWAKVATTSAAEAAAELRRLIEFHLSDGPEPPADVEPPPEPDWRGD